MTRPSTWRRLGDRSVAQRLQLVIAAVGVAAIVAFWLASPVVSVADNGMTTDAYHFWSFDLADPYRYRWTQPGSYVYSPAIAQALTPFHALPFEVFYKLQQAVNLACIVWLVGPAIGALSLLALPVQHELMAGNVHLPLAVIAVLGLRYPALGSFALLTKVTPGVGLVWFAVRREWRSLWIALAVTTAIALVSFAFAPHLWFRWFEVLRDGASSGVELYAFPQDPITERGPIAVVLVALAAWRNRPAALPVIVLYALPAVWFSAFVMLLAVPKMLGRHAGQLDHGQDRRSNGRGSERRSRPAIDAPLNLDRV